MERHACLHFVKSETGMESIIPWLASQCDASLLAEKWLVADELRIAQQWKDRVNLSGSTTINLHSKTLATIVLSLVSSDLAAKRLTFAGEPMARMLVRSVICELQDAGKLEHFGDVQSVEGLSDLLAKSIRDLRLAGISPKLITADGFQSMAKAADLRLLYQAYCDLLTSQQMLDYAGAVELAREHLADGTIRLPDNLLILIPELAPLSVLEQSLLDTLAAKSIVVHPEELDVYSVASASLPERIASAQATCRYFAGLGEVNEIRGVFQEILSSRHGEPYRLDDTEIVHTDREMYVPLILEQLTSWLADQQQDDPVADLDKLPVTFADGIACIYARPGRALRGWLRWARYDFIQARAVQLIREGLLARPSEAESIGYSRLANTLREVPIGFKIDRYLQKIRESIQSAQEAQREFESRSDREAAGPDQHASKRDFGLPALQVVLSMIQPLVTLAPLAADRGVTTLDKAKRFLRECARAESKLDRYARQKLTDDIDGMIRLLQANPDAELDVISWLEALPIESRILASGPQPGCVHVAPLSRGGHSGRGKLFVVGLDDGRFPRRSSVDPILLDGEREHLSSELPTSTQLSDFHKQSLDRALYRTLDAPGKQLWFSYSVRNLAEDRTSFPSPSMLELFRITEQNDDAHLDDLLAHLGAPVAFVSSDPDGHLSVDDGRVLRFLTESDPKLRQRQLEESYSHARFQRTAADSFGKAELSAYDGLVPTAGLDLDPTNVSRISASQLETFGTCPRRFFFSRGLGVYAPEEWVVDRERWLDPLQFGNFVHHLFEQFLSDLTKEELVPSVDRDLDPLRRLLSRQLDALKSQIPIPNEDAYRRTCDLLEEMCEIFLASEEEYCRQHHARPWVLEAAMGLDGEPRTELDCRDPIPLSLSDGRLIRVGGRLDRVDKLMLGGSERFAIWDYKSGSSYGFDPEKPFAQGRKLQPYLYLSMLRHRIASTGRGTDAVESFGYFFPNPKTDGLRMRWTQAELRGGDPILKQICDLITSGAFLPTTDPRDCTYCDYLSVCGDPDVVTQRSSWKSAQSCNSMLEPWRSLREIELEG